MGPISRETKDWMSSAKRHLGITARKDGVSLEILHSR